VNPEHARNTTRRAEAQRRREEATLIYTAVPLPDSKPEAQYPKPDVSYFKELPNDYHVCAGL
jgi:hypothetical protein